MKSVDLLIFDLDGTLVDTKADIVNAVNFTLNKLGLKQKSESLISSYIGRGVEFLLKNSLDKADDKLLSTALSIFEGYYRQHYMDNSVLYPGVKEVLEYFRHKKKVIVSNKNYELVKLTLEATGIKDYFADIIGGDDISCAKPSSCPLDKGIDRLDIDKQRAIIIGDMDIDILAGKSAGIITCAVTYGIGRREDILKAQPDYMIDTFLKLKEIIK
jgi:phosphoglycolate phosphatase